MRRSPVALLLFVSACEDATAPSAPRVRFEEVEIVFNAACTESGCHGPTRAGGLQLHEDAWQNLVGVDATGCSPPRKRVVPFQPRRSYLMQKLAGTDLCAGERMPRGCSESAPRACLSDERLAILEAWIAQGARRD